MLRPRRPTRDTEPDASTRVRVRSILAAILLFTFLFALVQTVHLRIQISRAEENARNPRTETAAVELVEHLQDAREQHEDAREDRPVSSESSEPAEASETAEVDETGSSVDAVEDAVEEHGR